MKVISIVVAVAACTVLLLLTTKCEGQSVPFGLYHRCSSELGFMSVQGNCKSVIRNGRKSSSVNQCCKELRQGGNTCSCIMAVSEPNKTKIIRSLIQNKVIRDICGFNNQTVESMLNCTSFNQTVQGSTATYFPPDCSKYLEYIKDNCASIVAQAKVSSNIAINPYDLKTRACCADMSTYVFSICSCLAITKNAKVGATSETVDFFKFATTNEAIADRCATPVLEVHCKVLTTPFVKDVDLCQNQYGEPCGKNN